jgi:parallel beta helix pectate lyase-like protein
MKNIQRIIKWATLVAIPILLAGQAHAQATRTWVSGVGDDANPCSRTAPCKTFAGAISKTAPGGEISVLDPGGYGAVTITKAITINGEGTLASTLVAGTNGIVISAGPSDAVTIRNIDITGIGSGIDGIRFLAGGSLNVEKTRIYGFTGEGIAFLPASSTSTLNITNSWIHNNATGGVRVAPAAGAFARATLDHVYLLGNGRGVRAEGGASVFVSNSVASGSTGNGFMGTDPGRLVELMVESSVSSGNAGAGVSAGTFTNVRISNNNITKNGVGVSPAGGTVISFGNNAVSGNTTDGAPNMTVGKM